MNLHLGRLSPTDVERMVDRLFLTEGKESGRKMSAFWVLLLLAGVIASAGVSADSVATVIGAMIVAPLMTPILGTALALVLANRRQLMVNVALVLGGAASVIAIGYLFGMLSPLAVTSDSNSQVAARVAPRLIDLIAALATGCVGSFAQVRSDVSDTLPGVAIAISLVPPLAVVGLTWESGAPDEALGALLLFATNVTAIIATGTLVLLGYRLRKVAHESGVTMGELSGTTIALVIGMVLVVAVPLAAGSYRVIHEQLIVTQVRPLAQKWALADGWRLGEVAFRQGALHLLVIGDPTDSTSEADANSLREDLNTAGLADVDVVLNYVQGGEVELPGR